jgi:5-methylcytosine-specific restriction endonuclease McrBC GTP-binding regulatory subunit McrB
MARKEIPPQAMDTMRALERLLHREQLLSEPLVIGDLVIEDRGVREGVFSGGPGGPWPRHPYHLFQVRWQDWEGEIFIGPFIKETNAYVLVGVWGDYGAALELNCTLHVKINSNDALDIRHSGAMTVVGHGRLKDAEVRSYVGERCPEIVRGSQVDLGRIPIKAELEFADVQDFLARMIKYGLARRKLKERRRREEKGQDSLLEQQMGRVSEPDDSPLGSLAKYVRAQGFHFPSNLLAAYFLSLQTKPFAILTGVSGTGKTKLAQLFAEWMSPVVETEVTVAESPQPTDTSFYIEIKPYMLKYSRAVVPVGVWQYFDVPELGQSTQVRLAYPGGEEVCKLGLQPHPQNPNGYLQLLFKGGLRRWMRDNLAVGDLLMIETIGEEGEAYRLEKYRPQTRTVVERERNYAFVPVRPDWTDSRGLLGFHNLITGTYSATDFLRLLLRAAINLQSARPRPYFVILDEMNLAKVEYYFADFLSAMESRRLGEGGNIEQERLILHNQPRCVLAAGNEEVVDASYYHEERFTCLVKCEECPFTTFVDEGYHHNGEFDYEEARATGFTPQHFVPPRLTVPLNVYFAGTVNVDETTYMFSPKVLDRANTIEFGDVHLDTYFSVAQTDGATASTADEQTIEIFADNRQFTLLPKQLPELRSNPELAPYRDQLVRLNQLLKPFEMHFGYRVADEVLLYLWNAQELNDPAFDLEVAFDHQIYQKVLPKFHGSQAKLREPLEALGAFCEEHGYGLSAAKIQRMLDMLIKEGFASFA